jgi:hypothetical protein
VSDLQMKIVVGVRRHALLSSWAKADCLSLF